MIGTSHSEERAFGVVTSIIMWVSVFEPFRHLTWIDRSITRLNIAIQKGELTGSTLKLGRAFGRNQTVSNNRVASWSTTTILTSS